MLLCVRQACLALVPYSWAQSSPGAAWEEGGSAPTRRWAWKEWEVEAELAAHFTARRSEQHTPTAT